MKVSNKKLNSATEEKKSVVETFETGHCFSYNTADIFI